jgi:hypothetical protein
MHHRIMVHSERESTNEIARFRAIEPTIPAISIAALTEKQTPAQSLSGLFTDDGLPVSFEARFRSRLRMTVYTGQVSVIPRSRASGVSKGETNIGASWFTRQYEVLSGRRVPLCRRSLTASHSLGLLDGGAPHHEGFKRRWFGPKKSAAAFSNGPILTFASH